MSEFISGVESGEGEGISNLLRNSRSGAEVIVTNRYKGSGPEKHQIERYVTVNVYFQGWHVT